MVKIFDITNWEKMLHVHTGGTRDKFIAIEPVSEVPHYFKRSIKKGYKNYPFEFWSEIIASHLGILLQFDVCEYNIAYTNDKIGCISRSLINTNQTLKEGVDYIIEIDPEFRDGKNYKKHTYKLIIRSLSNQNIEHLEENVLSMIIFDAIIGNSDRHSENWGLILESSPEFKAVDATLSDIKNKIQKKKLKIENLREQGFSNIFSLVLETFKYLKLRHEIQAEEEKFNPLIKRFRFIQQQFSPIYDSGCSLGRELDDTKITKILSNKDLWLSYHRKAMSDIKIDDNKINHFELIDVLLSDKAETICNIVNRIKSIYNRNDIERLIINIDNLTPEQFSDYKLSETRKKFIIEFICYRIEQIINIIN